MTFIYGRDLYPVKMYMQKSELFLGRSFRKWEQSTTNIHTDRQRDINDTRPLIFRGKSHQQITIRF